MRRRSAGKRHEPLSLDAAGGASGDEDASAFDPRDPREAAPERLAAREHCELLLAEVARLDPEQREVIVLREFQDLSYEEIAEVVGVPVGTVRSRLFRARGELRERLRDRVL